MNKGKTISLLIALMIIIGGAVYYWKNYSNPKLDQKPNQKTDNSNETAISATTTPSISVIKKENTGYKGQSINYLGDPKVLILYPKEYVDGQQKRLDQVADLIKKTPNDATYWMEAGLVKKNFDNYIGTRDVWEYAKKLGPSNAVNYFNLGNLYGKYLSNFPEAEKNYLQAVALDPHEPYIYLGMAEFYQDFYKEKSERTEAVLLAGLRTLPLEPNMNLMLALYYKSVNNKDGAINYFEKFLKCPGITDLQQKEIEQELQTLRG